ncbi:aspartyl protease protein [Rutstroemia sp. NJR-2017a WRK4]|nr:aspartyl protease protein [Rutstroemia sp. NJR-2017a WRK4]
MSLNLAGSLLSGLVLFSSMQNTRSEAAKIPLHRRISSSNVTGSTNYDGGFWFTNITIGSSAPANLLVDTGSADLVLNPGLYKASSQSKNLNSTFAVTYGTTTGGGAGSTSQTIIANLYNDTTTFHSLTVPSQTIGTTGANHTTNSTYPGGGILGLGNPLFSGSGATPFFHNLCAQDLIPECRFGLALQTDATGSLTFGELDSDLVPGGDAALTKVPLVMEWFVYGDVVLDGEYVFRDALLEFDSGTTGIVGPISAISALFAASGVQSVLQTSPSGDTLVGYYPCSSPPAIGFSLPSQGNLSSISSTSKTFYIENSAPAASSSVDNCTSVFSGYDFETQGLWVLGERFFRDHDLGEGVLGVVGLEKGRGGDNGTATGVVSSGAGVGRYFKGLVGMSLLTAVVVGAGLVL